MYFIFKMTVIVFVLQLKLNGLSLLPIIDQSKYTTSSSDNVDNHGLYTQINAFDSDKQNNGNDNSVVAMANPENESSEEPKHILTVESSSGSALILNSTNGLPNSNTLQSNASRTYLDVDSIKSFGENAATNIEIMTNTMQMQDEDDSEELDLKDERYFNGANSLKKFFVKHAMDDGHSCLLDYLKDDILWWSHTNGSLKTMNASYSKHKLVDLSHRNISNDDELLRKMGKLFLRRDNVLIFSAAFNHLVKAPYQTLISMRNSLKFLSLRGNHFKAFNENILTTNRLSNDTAYNSTNGQDFECNFDVNNKIIRHLDRYQLECILKNLNYTNSNLNLTQHIHLAKRNSNFFGNSNEGIAWATFPVLPQLLELDISNCSIEYITREVFINMTNLHRLYMSHNKIMTIPFHTFYYIQKLQYLDLSFTNTLNYNYQLYMPTLEVALSLVYGLKIQRLTFKMLPALTFLDLSHTKLTRNSAMAIAHLGSRLKYLSLCYTALPIIEKALFKNTPLVGLDLSGNPMASYNLFDDAFEGISDTLNYLQFEYSNLKDLGWLGPLKKLRVLSLAGNNVNVLSTETFKSLKSLQVLDLSSNHVGNWYKRVFEFNTELRILKLRRNNINILTTEMLKDFEQLNYLSLGENNFVCDCLLSDLIEVAAKNNDDPDCVHMLLQNAGSFLINNEDRINRYFNLSMNINRDTLPTQSSLYELLPNADNVNIVRDMLARNLPLLERSYQNIKNYQQKNNKFTLRFLTNDPTLSKCIKSASALQSEHNTQLKFQLLDYEEEHYWCYNQTEQLHVSKLNCQKSVIGEEITVELHSLTTTIITVVGTIAGVSLLVVIVYLKRWHLHYYYASLKTANLLSSASKESVDRLNELAMNDPNMVYDIFISYCQSDRQWVLDELLPNVEESCDISICLHERDFKIGVTILDNIVSCMDRSRALMLIISRKFLLSHWCQFEMYLAHHRIFEARKEQLILVLLEDIPRTKRPKTLQYLMDVKTYIKWPSSKGNKQPSPDERKLFWKRLKRSLEYKGIRINESST